MLGYFCLLWYVETPEKFSGSDCLTTDMDLDLLSPSGACPLFWVPGGCKASWGTVRTRRDLPCFEEARPSLQ